MPTIILKITFISNKTCAIVFGMEIEHTRHSLAHLLGAAVMKLYPDAELTLGPAIDDGFYYDIKFATSLSSDDLPKIEAKMKEMIPSWKMVNHKEVSKEQALEYYKGNIFKEELINEISERGEKITLYTMGEGENEFTDLCRGGHTDDLSIIDPESFKLSRTSGAYWRGNENNPMLTRIYGYAFSTKIELDEHLEILEEAKKRDHRKIAKEQDLIVFSDLVGSGMPMYTPKGNLIRNGIISYSRELNDRLGFGEVHTPNINKGELFKISGHYDQYKEDMLTVKSQYVADEMFLKPMNCPQHTQIYASQPRSYRDLPIRYSDFANLYRDERPGELSGLTRLRSFAQDDGHIFCREDQIEEEVVNILGAIQEALSTYKIDYWMRLSLRDPENKIKYLGEDSVWERSQTIMRKLLEEKGIPFKSMEGEAAFYGPKIDIMAVDALKREWQISTIQLDFNMPKRFELEYTDNDGAKKTPVMIHRALIGSPDRFMGILIEHYAGAFPTWLSPLQVAVLPVGEMHEEYAKSVNDALKKSGMRTELWTTDGLGKRIRKAKVEKVPYQIVIGDKERDGNTVTVEGRNELKLEQIELKVFIERITEEIKTRKDM
jgi:threonyl-tRNA synthetase